MKRRQQSTPYSLGVSYFNRSCPICGEALNGTRSVFCSAKCRKRHQRKLDRMENVTVKLQELTRSKTSTTPRRSKSSESTNVTVTTVASIAEAPAEWLKRMRRFQCL